LEKLLDIASLIETWGDTNALAMAGALVGFIFGLAAQRTRFCARAAAIECCQGRPAERFSVWFLGFAACLLGVQLLVWLGALQPSTSRYIAQPGSISGAVLGGLCFGAGMIMTRGCASRLLILSANGNLRALLAGLVFAATVQASIAGWLAPARQALVGWWPIDGGPGRDLLQLSGLGAAGGLLLAGVAFSWALYAFFKTHASSWGLALGAICVGLAIAGGWGLTQLIASHSFEAVQIQSLSFSSASAEMLMRAMSTGTAPRFGFDAGLLPATFFGSWVGAVIGGDFRWEGFKSENKLGHYLIGALLMGFGAVMAGGCTVGAGMTGGSVFALTAWLTLIAIGLGACMAWRLHRRMGWPV
jgi:uncharacterized membrane protein YedE/YeeE